MPQRTVPDTVLLSGWLFADLFLGLMVIFLAALPGAQPIVEIQTLDANITTLSSTSPQCTGQLATFQCTIMLKETIDSRGDVTWIGSSDISDAVSFSPSSGSLSPNKSLSVTISAIPCQNGSFTFSGAKTTKPIIILWKCQLPPERLDFTPQTFSLNVQDTNGLLGDSQDAINDIKQQVRSQSILSGRSVGLALVYDGAPTTYDISTARAIAQKVYDILTALGQEDGPNSPFHRASTYVPLYNLGESASSVQVDVFLFTH